MLGSCSNDILDQRPARNVLAGVGFIMSVVSVLALSLAGIGQVFVLCAFVAIPAFAISLLALLWQPRQLALCGIGVSFLVCLYLPTLIVALP